MVHDYNKLNHTEIIQTAPLHSTGEKNGDMTFQKYNLLKCKHQNNSRNDKYICSDRINYLLYMAMHIAWSKNTKGEEHSFISRH